MANGPMRTALRLTGAGFGVLALLSLVTLGISSFGDFRSQSANVADGSGLSGAGSAVATGGILDIEDQFDPANSSDLDTSAGLGSRSAMAATGSRFQSARAGEFAQAMPVSERLTRIESQLDVLARTFAGPAVTAPPVSLVSLNESVSAAKREVAELSGDVREKLDALQVASEVELRDLGRRLTDIDSHHDELRAELARRTDGILQATNSDQQLVQQVSGMVAEMRELKLQVTQLQTSTTQIARNLPSARLATRADDSPANLFVPESPLQTTETPSLPAADEIPPDGWQTPTPVPPPARIPGIDSAPEFFNDEPAQPKTDGELAPRAAEGANQWRTSGRKPITLPGLLPMPAPHEPDDLRPMLVTSFSDVPATRRTTPLTPPPVRETDNFPPAPPAEPLELELESDHGILPVGLTNNGPALELPAGPLVGTLSPTLSAQPPLAGETVSSLIRRAATRNDRPVNVVAETDPEVGNFFVADMPFDDLLDRLADSANVSIETSGERVVVRPLDGGSLDALPPTRLRATVIHLSTPLADRVRPPGLRPLVPTSSGPPEPLNSAARHDDRVRRLLASFASAGDAVEVATQSIEIPLNVRETLPVGSLCLHCNEQHGVDHGDQLVLDVRRQRPGVVFITTQAAAHSDVVASLPDVRFNTVAGESFVLAEEAQEGTISTGRPPSTLSRLPLIGERITRDSAEIRYAQRLIVLTVVDENPESATSSTAMKVPGRLELPVSFGTGSDPLNISASLNGSHPSAGTTRPAQTQPLLMLPPPSSANGSQPGLLNDSLPAVPIQPGLEVPTIDDVPRGGPVIETSSLSVVPTVSFASGDNSTRSSGIQPTGLMVVGDELVLPPLPDVPATAPEFESRSVTASLKAAALPTTELPERLQCRRPKLTTTPDGTAVVACGKCEACLKRRAEEAAQSQRDQRLSIGRVPASDDALARNSSTISESASRHDFIKRPGSR